MLMPNTEEKGKTSSSNIQIPGHLDFRATICQAKNNELGVRER